MPVLYHTVDDSFLIDAIHRAKHEVSLTAPGISMAVAEALLGSAVRLYDRVQLLVDASPESFRLGYCDPAVIRFLQQRCRELVLHTFRSEPGIRTGVLTVDGTTIFFTPDLLTIEKFSSRSINAAGSSIGQEVTGDSIGLTNLTDIVLLESEAASPAIPTTKEEQLQAVIREQQAKLDSLEKKVKDLEQKKSKLPIQQNLQFVEIEVSQYRLDKLRIKIPSAFLTDTAPVNERMESKYLVLGQDEKWDEPMTLTIHNTEMTYTFADFSREIEELRNAQTVTLGIWKRVILTEKKDTFDKKWERLRDIAREIHKAMPRLLDQKIQERLEELYQSLKPQILRQYKSINWWNTDESEKAKKTFFFKQMQQEAENALKFFDPQIKVIYRDISREDAEKQEFRWEVEQAFGKEEAAKLFTEEKINNRTGNE